MRSAVVLLSVCGAVGSTSATCENDVDSQALLQSKRVVRHQGNRESTANDLLNSMQKVASSLTKDQSVTMTPEEVNAAVGQASTALSTMFPVLAQQHELAQHEIASAVESIEGCHQQHGGAERANRQERVAANFAAIDECEESLHNLGVEQQRACEDEDVTANCECTEARTAVTDHRALCAAETDRYGAVFCEMQLFCDLLHGCHAQRVSVYQDLMVDVEAAMTSRQQQYVTLQQTNCLMDLIRTAMSTGTPIDNNMLTSCSDGIDLTDLTLTFTDPPADPSDCHAEEDGDPQCDFDPSDLQPSAGSPDGCQCTQVQLQDVYSAGPVIRCDGCIDVHHTTDQNSCPSGWKIFSPASQGDWEVLHNALGDHSHHIASPARTPGFTTNWPASPWLIVDVSKATGHNMIPRDQRPAMNSGNPAAAEWHTSDGSPFWLRDAQWGQPDGNYNENCFLDIFSVNAQSMGFDDHSCVPHSSSYLCQREDFYGQTADGCPRDNTNAQGIIVNRDGDEGSMAFGSDTSGEMISTAAHTDSSHMASVRCCSMDGSTCASNLEGGCHAGKTLVEAEAICAANDKRLCTEHEMADNVCCNTGCWFNHHAVWVTPSTLGSNPRADTKCMMNGDRLFRSPRRGSSSITRAACFAQCQAADGCNAYSWGQHGDGNVCMGCTSLDNAVHHNGFTAYDM